MSKVLSVVGTVAGLVAAVAVPFGAPAIVAKIAAGVAVAANVGAAITARRPFQKGSQTDVTIGADMQSPWVVGSSYYGGNRVQQLAYGQDGDIPNAYARIVDVYSVGGPRSSLGPFYSDFSPISFDNTNAPHTNGEAIGYYHGELHRFYQLGETPESTVLGYEWGPPPEGGSAYKISGKAAASFNLRWSGEEDNPYLSGVPQFGALVGEPYLYDPREDDTYPGGSGDQRWADPSDKAAFAAAKATWTETTANPGITALAYALGLWERDETDTDAEYIKVFGIGCPEDGIIFEDFVELANVCDANGWECNGIIFEPGERIKWENLKDILAAGKAEPVFKGGKLGCRYAAPKVAVATVTKDDIAGGEIVSAQALPWKERHNTIQAKFRSAAHKWEYVPGSVVSSSALVTADGEVKRDTAQWNLVTDKNQAAQLTAYELADRREQTLELTVQQHMRGYWPGDLIALDTEMKAMLGVTLTNWEIRRRRLDPTDMTVAWTLVSETPGKDEFALSQTGAIPPDADIWSPDQLVVGLLEYDGEQLLYNGAQLRWG